MAVYSRNKIEGTPILKLAIVIGQKIRQKNSSKKLIKNFVKIRIRQSYIKETERNKKKQKFL